MRTVLAFLLLCSTLRAGEINVGCVFGYSDAAVRSALSTGNNLYFSAGTYTVDDTVDLTGLSVRGDGPYKSLIVSSAPDKPCVILCGNQLSVRDVGFGFDAPRDDPACACIYVRSLQQPGLIGLYRSVIENVRLFKGYYGVDVEVGNRAVMFSNTWNSVAIEEWRGWGYRNRSEGTGSVFNCLYGNRFPLTTDRPCKGLMTSVENEVVLNQVNCEWALIEETCIELNGGENALINSCHFEGIRFQNPNRSLITTSRPVLNINNLTIDDWHVEQSASPCSVIRCAGALKHLTSVNGCVVKDSDFADPKKVFWVQILKDSQGYVYWEKVFDRNKESLMPHSIYSTPAGPQCQIVGGVQ